MMMEPARLPTASAVDRVPTASATKEAMAVEPVTYGSRSGWRPILADRTGAGRADGSGVWMEQRSKGAKA
jgi:hypothetical protein